MIYNLIFSILGMVLTIMMLCTYFTKRRSKTTQSKFFVGLIMSSMLYGLFDVAFIFILKELGNMSELVRIIWNVRNGIIYIYIFVFGWYLNVLINRKEYKSLFYYFKRVGVLISVFLLMLILVFSISGGEFPGFVFDEPDFTGGNGFIGTMIVTFSCCLVGLFYGVKFRKERKYILNTFVLILILLLITFFFQSRYIYISFMPFITMIILLILYYNIENPDIALLREVSIIKNKIDKTANVKNEFLYNLSYDLINPMNAIVSLSQSLSNMCIENKDEIFRDLKSIKYAGNTLLDSIDSILDLSNMNEDGNFVNEKEYSSYEIFKKIETVATSRIGSKQVRFEMNIDDNISSRLFGDVTKIQSVLLNIVTNACIHTDIGKVVFNVNVTNDKDLQILHFIIQDTGCGIKEENLDSIFDGNDSSKQGLVMCKKIVESINGNLRIQSVYKAGTTVYIDIPQRKVGNKIILEDKNADKNDDIINFIDCSEHKILICDDDNLDIKVTKAILKRYNFKIDYVTDPFECIEKIKSGKNYDMLLLDYKMPGMNGLEVLKALKSLENYNLPKIVIFTANSVTGGHEYYINQGFDEYISKPIDIIELNKIINKFFKK